MPLPVPTTIATGFSDLSGSAYCVNTDQLYVVDAGHINAVTAHTHVNNYNAIDLEAILAGTNLV